MARFLVLGAILSVIVVSHFTIFPFVVGKTIVFRFFVELTAMCYLIAAIRPIGLTRPINPMVIATTVFVLISSIIGIFDYDPALSFWGTYVRGEGLIQLWHYYALFLLVILLFRDERHRQWLWWILVATAVGVIILGVVPWLRDYVVDSRFKGALGNPAFTAAFLLFAIGWAELLKRSWLIRGGLMAFFLIGIFLTGTRGALLGLGMGVVVVLVMVAYRYRRRIRLIGPICLISLIGAIGLIGSIGRTYDARIFKFSLAEQTAQTRLWIWQSALAGWRERPLLGWGPENFSEVFDRHFDARHYRDASKHSEVWFDRAHNVVADQLVTTGIVGLLAWLMIWAVYYWQLLTNRKSFSKKEQVVFSALPAIYLGQGMLVFDTLATQINVMILWGVVAAMYIPIASSNILISDINTLGMRRTQYSPKVSVGVVGLISLIILGFIFSIYFPLRKAILFNNALAKVAMISSVAEFQSTFQPALRAYSPYGQDEILKMMGGVVIDLLQKNPSPEVAHALVQFLDEEYQSVLARGRGNVFAENYFIIGRAHELAGEREVAARYYQEALTRWPRRVDFVDYLKKI